MLITGATGFTGRHAFRCFKEKGYDVFGVSRHAKKAGMLQADVTKRDEAFQIIQGVQPDFVLHLAGQNAVDLSWKHPLTTFDANLAASLHMLEAIRNHQPKAKMIVVGSALEDRIGDDQPPSHPYGLSKALQSWLAVKWAELFGLHVIVAKPTNLIGPGFSNGVCARFAETIADMEKRGETGTITIANPEIRRDFLDVRDVVKGYDVLFRKGTVGEIYELGSGQSVSLLRIAHIYQKISEISFAIDVLNELVQLSVPPLNIKKMNDLGWKPTISLKQSLMDCLNFYRQCGG